MHPTSKTAPAEHGELLFASILPQLDDEHRVRRHRGRRPRGQRHRGRSRVRRARALCGTLNGFRNVLISEHLDGCLSTRFQSMCDRFCRLLEERLAHISLKSWHAALSSRARKAFDSIAALVVVVTIKHALTARVKNAKCCLHEIIRMLLLTCTEARHTGLDAVAFRIIGQDVPDVLPASVKRLGPTTQRMLALLISQAFPYR